uniref:Uncharacterized protein n=1 Tax=Panagrolaimus sp. ES5 TaxID=591445 RepID=A0AC34G7V1_9BILA
MGYDCVSLDRATNDPRYTAISYLGVNAVIIEKQYIGNYGTICDGNELCSTADKPDGHPVTYKANSGISENTCFIVRANS